jgi:hypothetical protein
MVKAIIWLIILYLIDSIFIEKIISRIDKKERKRIQNIEYKHIMKVEKDRASIQNKESL